MFSLSVMNDFLYLGIQAAYMAAQSIMPLYQQGFWVKLKKDQTPVTHADIAAHQTITEQLSGSLLPILSEEGVILEAQARQAIESYWLVDPLDGTREFIKKNGEFTINIALIHNQKPHLGVVYAPALGQLYYAHSQLGAYHCELPTNPNLSLQAFTQHTQPLQAQRLILSTKPSTPIRVVMSRSHTPPHTSKYLQTLQNTHGELSYTHRGSALKICLVATGEADVYPRFGPTMEWDTAAGQAIVEAAGGVLLDACQHTPLVYNKTNLENPSFIAACHASLMV